MADFSRRRAARRALGPLAGGIETDTEENDDTGETTASQPTSIQDLTTAADPEEFDRTFSDGDAKLGLEGAFDPVAGPKQVLPRVAYTINFNFVYNDSKDRWEPDTGNGSGGGFPIRDSGTLTIGNNSDATTFTGITDMTKRLRWAVGFEDTSDVTDSSIEIWEIDGSEISAQTGDAFIGVNLSWGISGGEWRFTVDNVRLGGSVTINYRIFEVTA